MMAISVHMLGRLYKQQAQLEDLKKKEKEETKMDAKDTKTAYPREVLDMLARLYNASRENKDEEEEKLMRSSRMLERENIQTEWMEQGEEEEEEEGEAEEVVEEVDNLLVQMYNSSEGVLSSALLRVVLEGRKEKEEEEEMMERCSREEERVYQVKRFFFFHFFHILTRRPISDYVTR